MSLRLLLVSLLLGNINPTNLGDDIVTLRIPLFRSVYFVGNQFGWIASHRNMFDTRNGGQTWRRNAIALASEPSTSVRPADLNVGMILWGDKENVLMWGNGELVVGSAESSTWDRRAFPAVGSTFMTAIGFSSFHHGYALDSSGSVYRTGDAGKSWALSGHLPATRVRSLYTFSAQEIWAVGKDASVLFSSDRGEHWEGQTLRSAESKYGTLATIECVRFISAKEGWLCGTDGLVFHTIDGGRRWERQQTPFSSGSILQAISFVSPTEGWVVGSKYSLNGSGSERYEAIVLHTIDGGLHWEPVNTKIQDTLLAVQALSNGRAWAVGANGTVLQISDHGRRWTQVNLG
ncbi:MAG: YCF48-related protein [Acidobacteriota bacterium]